MPRRNRKPYKFQDIRHSRDGIMATVLGILSVLLIIGEIVMTIQTRGQAGEIAGFMGVAALLFSVVGFIFGVISWKDEETMDTYKRVGTLMNIVLILINLAVVALGIIA